MAETLLPRVKSSHRRKLRKVIYLFLRKVFKEFIYLFQILPAVTVATPPPSAQRFVRDYPKLPKH